MQQGIVRFLVAAILALHIETFLASQTLLNGRSYPDPVPFSPWTESRARWVFISDTPLEEVAALGGGKR